MKPQPDDIAEAERLKLLPKDEQRKIVEEIGSPAIDASVPDEDRREARRRAKVLMELLKLKSGKKR